MISNSLRCFISLLKYPLPSLRTQVQAFVDRLFILLADYAAVGGAGNKGVGMELNRLLFKVSFIMHILLVYKLWRTWLCI